MYRVRRDVHAVELDGEILVWDPSAQQLHRLNTSAAQVWLALGAWCSLAELVEGLADSLGLSAADIHADVQGYVTELRGSELLDEKTVVTRA